MVMQIRHSGMLSQAFMIIITPLQLLLKESEYASLSSCFQGEWTTELRLHP
jgi:hypothetical protein